MHVSVKEVSSQIVNFGKRRIMLSKKGKHFIPLRTLSPIILQLFMCNLHTKIFRKHTAESIGHLEVVHPALLARSYSTL